MQYLQSAVTEQKTILESITFVVALNLLCDNFEMTTAPLFYFGNKDLTKIIQIVTSIEAVNLVKFVVKAITDLLMVAKKKQLKK